MPVTEPVYGGSHAFRLGVVVVSCHRQACVWSALLAAVSGNGGSHANRSLGRAYGGSYVIWPLVFALSNPGADRAFCALGAPWCG